MIFRKLWNIQKESNYKLRKYSPCKVLDNPNLRRDHQRRHLVHDETGWNLFFCSKLWISFVQTSGLMAQLRAHLPRITLSGLFSVQKYFWKYKSFRLLRRGIDPSQGLCLQPCVERIRTNRAQCLSGQYKQSYSWDVPHVCHGSPGSLRKVAIR